MQGEIGVTAETPAQLAQLWLNLAAYWESVADKLEQARLTANAGIAGATTRSDVDAALARFDDAIDSLPTL